MESHDGKLSAYCLIFILLFMAKSSVLSRPKVASSVQRNGFDRSSRKSFNFSAGMLIPVDWRPVPAGSKVKLNRKCFIRTADVNTAAFTPIDFFVDYYKVPLRYLWSHWNDFKLNINDLNSTSLFSQISGSLDTVQPGQIPSFDINEFYHLTKDAVGANVSGSPLDSNGFLYFNGMCRLIDMLRYGGLYDFATQQPLPFLVNPFAACAYQKIYFDHYRNTSYESNDPYAYNLDWLQSRITLDMGSRDSQAYKALYKMFNLRYVNYRNDYFMNLYPALNYVSSQPSGTSWSIPSSVSGLGSSSGYMLPVNAVASNSPYLAQPGSSTDSTRLTIQSIRALFALDKLMRASAYAPKHVKDQFKARFGVTMNDSVSFESERIGSFKTDIKLMEVTSSADTDRAGLGAIGAKGIGVGQAGDTIECYCEEDSIVMGVAYAMPRTSYDMHGCDEWSTKLTRDQLIQPEFMNLGLEPVYMWMLRRGVASLDGVNTYNNTLLGYRPRQQVYKLSIDGNHGEFRYYNPQKVGTLTDTGEVTLTNSLGSHELEKFVVHSLSRYMSQNPLLTPYSVNYQYFKVNPMDLNDLFVGQYNLAGDQVTDQFFCYFEQDMPVIQNLPVHGQPRM